MVAALLSAVIGGVSVGGDGWTVITPSSDTRVVHVSSSLGDDTNDGLSESAPVRTIEMGKSLLRDGHPDWLLLRRGDTWIDETLGRWEMSGRSEQERMLISGYGSGNRPLIMPAHRQGGLGLVGSSNIAVIGVELYAYTRDPRHAGFVGANSERFGIGYIDFSGQAQANLLVEDALIRMFDTNIVIQDRSGGPLSNLALRRSVIVDAYDANSHSQGLYVYGVDGILIEENVFDHNGWYGDRDTGGGVGGNATTFNHNIYLANANPSHPNTRDETGHIIVRGNTILRASASAIQMRSGGTLENNLFVRNGGAMLGGRGTMPEVVNPDGVDLVFRNNVALEGVDVRSDSFAGRGIWVANVRSATIEGNIVAHDIADERATRGFIIDGSLACPSRGIRVIGNTFYRWRHSGILISGRSYVTIDVEENNNYWSASTVGWPITGTNRNSADLDFRDPDRNVANYNAAAGGEASFEAFAAEARQQSRSNWRTEYTAAAVNEYVRDGFFLEGEEPNESIGPVTDDDSSLNQVRENSSTGTPVGITALAIDPDEGDTVTYLLADNADGRFQINANSGVVMVADGTLLDYETQPTHAISIMATSSDGSSTFQGFIIEILDVEEVPEWKQHVQDELDGIIQKTESLRAFVDAIDAGNH